MAVSAERLPFREQIEFLRRKLPLETDSWTDIYGREHDYTLVVAGANRRALIEDFAASILKIADQGTSLEQFRRDFDRIVAEHGWSYNGSRNWRSRVIYETNLRSSYMAGRFAQLTELAAEMPYWQYLHSDAVEHPRPIHESWDGMVLRWDDPWWQQHFPPNGWGCQCGVMALSEADLVAMGKSGPDVAPPDQPETRTIGQRSLRGPRDVTVPKGIDPGFEHTPGRGRLESQVPQPRDGDDGIPRRAQGAPNTVPDFPLPTPTEVDAERLLPRLPRETPAERDAAELFYETQWLADFGATLDAPAVFVDAVGEALVIGRDMFWNARQQRYDKADKNGRGVWLLALADALKRPDEIWARLEWNEGRNKPMLVRRYVKRLYSGSAPVPALGVFEVGPGGWVGTTTFNARDTAYLNDQRQGVLLYRRGR